MLTGKTLEDLYKLDADKMKNQVIQVSVSGNAVNNKAYINFNKICR